MAKKHKTDVEAQPKVFSAFRFRESCSSSGL